MKVAWTLPAERDRSAIWDYLLARNPTAAVKMDLLFSEAASSLGAFPMLGHQGQIPGTRELTPHRRYRLIYEIAGDVIWILALIHTAREWPPRTL